MVDVDLAGAEVLPAHPDGKLALQMLPELANRIPRQSEQGFAGAAAPQAPPNHPAYAVA